MGFTPTARVKILSLTDTGLDLAEEGVDVTPSRHGGAEHEYWKWRIAQHLERQGYVVTQEYPIASGRTVDLRAQRGENVLWIEVETGRSHTIANAKKCATLADRLTFVFTDAITRDRLRDTLDAVAVTTSELARL